MSVSLSSLFWKYLWNIGLLEKDGKFTFDEKQLAEGLAGSDLVWSPEAAKLRLFMLTDIPKKITRNSNYVYSSFETLNFNSSNVGVLDSALKKFTALRNLSISNNKITVVSNLPASLQMFNAFGNKIEEFDFSACTELLHVGLGYNCISNITNLRTVSSLMSLDLSFNGIVDIKECVGVLSSLKYLKQLSLNGNPICLLKNYRSQIVNNLSHLISLDDISIKEKELNISSEEISLSSSLSVVLNSLSDFKLSVDEIVNTQTFKAVLALLPEYKNVPASSELAVDPKDPKKKPVAVTEESINFVKSTSYFVSFRLLDKTVHTCPLFSIATIPASSEGEEKDKNKKPAEKKPVIKKEEDLPVPILYKTELVFQPTTEWRDFLYLIGLQFYLYKSESVTPVLVEDAKKAAEKKSKESSQIVTDEQKIPASFTELTDLQIQYLTKCSTTLIGSGVLDTSNIFKKTDAPIEYKWERKVSLYNLKIPFDINLGLRQLQEDITSSTLLDAKLNLTFILNGSE